MKISVTTSDYSIIRQLDVDSIEIVENIKAIIEAEIGIPLLDQNLIYNGILMQDTLTLSAIGVKENDMLLVMKKSESNGPPGGTTTSPVTTTTTSSPGTSYRGYTWKDIPPHCSPELMWEILNANQDTLLREIETKNPRYAAAARHHDASMLRSLMIEIETANAMKKLEADRVRNDLFRRATENPMDLEIQRRIQVEIEQRNIESNMEMAMEFNPEVFARVHMLYINTVVNGVPVKAFVDSGAQQTIMSEKCAEKCGIMRLVDKRFSGVAVGVGSAKITGRVHSTQITMGGQFFTSSFTVMENQKHSQTEFLLGLDMLKRHQCCIDLKKGVLRLEVSGSAVEVPFLAEHELPDHARLNEGGSSEEGKDESNSSIRDESKDEDNPDLSQLLALGFQREDAMSALASTGGNVDLAATLLFDTTGK